MDSILSAPPEWADSSATRWYVVFCNARERHWWDRLFRTPAGFQHCYAVRWDGFNWLLFNPHAAYTEVAIMPGTSENALHTLIEPEATVLEVEAFRRDRIRGRWWAGPMTCVEQLKALIGLSVGRVWTPWQLYRYLMEYRTDGQQTKSTSANSQPDRARATPAFRARQIDTH